MKIKNMSIRLRLTLLYSVILALTLVTFSSILYITQAQLTYDTIKTNLAHQAEGIVNSPRPIRILPSAPGTDPSTMPGRWIQVRSGDGTLVARTADLSDTTLPLSNAGLLAVQKGTPWVEAANVDGDSLLIYNQPVRAPNDTLQIIQIASPMNEREQSLSTLGWILVTGSSIVILAAFVIGWVLAGTALRPIHRITYTAQTIGAKRDFGRRVQHTGPNDEIGQLATTFNTMLNELETAYRQVEQALQVQRRFVADASHELRTPLTTVWGNIELLQREPPLDARESADILADVKDEVERLIRLVQQLLALARADAGRPVRGMPLPVQPLIQDVYRQAKLLAPDKRIDCEASLEANVIGDRDALKQVLLILLDNAIAHTPPRAAVGIGAALHDGHVEFSIRDTGPGIAANLLPHIFERFVRGDASRSGGGTGLGLSIAKELVHAQNGTITVSSQVGQGSTFTVALPLAVDGNGTG